MLKWKKYNFASIGAGVEELTDILAGMSGKNRVIKFVSAPTTANLFIRVYRDAEQFVDFECAKLTSASPLLPMDLPLAEGQLCKAGFYVSTGTITNSLFSIGYEETD